MKSARSTFLIGLMLLCCCAASAAKLPQNQGPVILPVADATDIRFTHVFFEKGPAHSRAHRIVQDQQGFLWFATADRLQRFDGYDVWECPQDPRDVDMFTRALIKDRSGKLWVARDRGVGIAGSPFGSLDEYDPATETFTHYPPHDQPFEGPIIDITQDRDGELWFATNQGLVRMNSITGRTTLYRSRSDDPATINADSVRTTLHTRDGSFWVATTRGLDRFDRRTGKVDQRIPFPASFPVGSRFEALRISLFEDHAGVLWATFSYGYGLALVDRGAGTLTFYSLDGAGTDNTIQSGVRAIQEDKDGNLWLGTVFSGVLKLDRDRTRFSRYRNNPGDPGSLAGDAILALFDDREGNLWVATNDAGVDRFTTRPLPFKRYRHEPGNPNSLDTDYTSAVYEDRRGVLWIGSRRSLSALDRKTARMAFFRKAGGPGELSGTWILSIVEDRSGDLWFGTLGQGLNRLNRRTGKFNTFRHDPADPQSLSQNTVNKLFVDSNGVMWAGTDDGLNAFDPATGHFRTYKAKGLREMRVRDIAEDLQGALWIALRATGLLRLDPITGQFTVFQHSTQTTSLSSDKAWAVNVDRAGIVWIGTESGLNRLDPATGAFTAYFESDGLANNSVSHILEDEHGDLWVSTHNGLSRFNPRERTFKNYYTSDGLAGNEFYDSSSNSKSASGEMFFSANGGLTAFFPRQIIDDLSAPPVVITDFRIFSNPVPIGGKSPLQRAIAFTDAVTLSHQQNVLSLKFSALSYVSPERNRYRYRMERIETRWNESEGNQRSITYALPPGEYVFRVQGSSRRGAWNEQGASVRLTVLPPWWSTWRFRSGVLALLLLTLMYAYHLHLHNLKREFCARLEGRVDERLRVARDLHDTLLQGFQGVLLRFQAAHNLLPGRATEAKQILETALDDASQAIIEARDAVQDLRSFTVVPTELPKAVEAVGEELAEQIDVEDRPAFSVELEGAPQNLHPILRDEIYRIAREALRNAFHHARARRIEVEIRYGAHRFRLLVRDDGIGIHAAVLGQGGRNGHHGLTGMHERARGIGGQLEVLSRQGVGTEVELTVPASVAYQDYTRRRFRLFESRVGRNS